MDARTRRIAENESRFRDINERLQLDLRRLPVGDDPVGFICECGKLDCTQSVPLTLDEYEGVRQDPATFAVLPGHQIPDAEDVLYSSDRYLIVRKNPPSLPVVESTYDRGRPG
jgi:hypothetical protein